MLLDLSKRVSVNSSERPWQLWGALINSLFKRNCPGGHSWVEASLDPLRHSFPTTASHQCLSMAVVLKLDNSCLKQTALLGSFCSGPPLGLVKNFWELHWRHDWSYFYPIFCHAFLSQVSDMHCSLKALPAFSWSLTLSFIGDKDKSPPKFSHTSILSWLLLFRTWMDTEAIFYQLK